MDTIAFAVLAIFVMEIVRLVWKTFLNQQRTCIELQKSLPQNSLADAVSSCHPKRSAVMKEEELSEDASIALAPSDSPSAVLLGRKEFDADSEEIDAGCCGVSSADLDVFGNRIISGDDDDNDNCEDVEELLSEDASIALASSDSESPSAVLLGRKEFDADSEEIDAGCCGVSSADLDVFGNRIVSGDFKNLKSLNLVGYYFYPFFSVVE
jgi:hypothetical protein